MEEKTTKIEGIVKTVLFSLAGLAAVLFVFGGFKIIDAGERGVVLRLGKINRIVEPGLNLKWPLAEKIQRFNVQTQKEQVRADSASKDLQVVTTVLALNYHIDPARVSDLRSKIGTEDQAKVKIIDPAIQESVKAATAKYTAEELITKRTNVRDDIKLSLSERLTREFILVDEVSIVNFDFSNSFNSAIEAKVTAEQNALAAKNKLEQIKFEAEQRVTSAKAEAEAIRIQAQAITQQGGSNYVQLKWVEAWEKGGSKVPQVINGGEASGFLLNLDVVK